jgi:hypothetical protein
MTKTAKASDTFQHNGFKITDQHDGFMAADNMLGLIASFLAVKGEQVYGFAFAIDPITLALRDIKISQDGFIPLVKQTIMRNLDNGNLQNLGEYTFEYDPDQELFIEVSNPAWWVKSRR